MPFLSPDSSTSPTIPLTLYLFTYLTQLHCTHLYGILNNYNLTFLDHVYHPSTNPSIPLPYIGSCNELNAGYSCIHGLGVGELSAINAIGGAHTEGSSVVHIVGTRPRAAQKDGSICITVWGMAGSGSLRK
jgi:TPP-dependent 2-oxoacid decarboxylase